MFTRTVTAIFIFCTVLLLPVIGAETAKSADSRVEIARYEDEFSSAMLEPAQYDGRKGIAVVFSGTEDLHYYAREETTPAPGLQLIIDVQSPTLIFDKPVFPEWEIFRDPVGIDVEVYVGDFAVFIPFAESVNLEENEPADVTVKLTGLACTSKLCLPPFEKTLQLQFNAGSDEDYKIYEFEKAKTGTAAVTLEGFTDYPIWYAMVLALLAGLSLNIMPCVWPMLPLVVLRIVERGRDKTGRKIAMGLAFAIGIILFFACLAAANIVLHLVYSMTLGWGDQFRNTNFVIAMALVLVALAMFMFDVFAITVPASVSGKTTSSKGYLGTVGMGFLAAILSTPCSFGILAAAFAWAQGQPLIWATIAILAIGVGMAIPYVILTAIPGLLEKLPKPGKWMDIFKKLVGFVLVAVAAWMITIVPSEQRNGVLYFVIILAFCLWMWGGWVGFGSKRHNKIIVRIIAAALVLAAGWWLLKPKTELIDWQSYDANKIESAIKQDRPVLIKFTADWCLSCKVAEQLVYSRRDVADLIEEKGVLPIKADTTLADYPATIALADVYKEPGVPVSILLLPGDKDVRWHGKAFADELIEQMEKLPDKAD
ncbi:MAG: cytochrome c biogenesis protein CcdA [Phycisphaerae bacterium]